MVELLARLHATGECEAVTGVAVETWLLSAGLPASDRRMLSTATVQLGRLPSVTDGFARRQLSWGQVRTICLLTERLSAPEASEFDLTLAPSIVRYADCDPDGLLAVARQIVDRLRTDHVAAEAERVEREAFVALQPRLDGTGGRFHGDLDGLGFGLVAAALSAGRPLPERRRELVGQSPTHDPEGDRARMVRAGKWRADRLVQLCADDLARRGQTLTPDVPLAADATTGGTGDGAGGDLDGGLTGGVDRTRALAPEATLVMDVGQLLGDDGLPVQLLTKLTGGRLQVASSTARDWLDQAGCRLRTIVLDDTGQVLGVGRASRRSPGWLTDTLHATDATCRAPGCRAAATVCDIDHHTPWHPRPDAVPGRTDARNLGPACRADNNAKHTQGWQVERHHDGTVAWTHPRSGLTVRTMSWATARAAWRPPDQRPPKQRRDRHPPDRWRGTPPSELERHLLRYLDEHATDHGHDPPPF